MQKVVIADDDEILLQGLMTLVPWEKTGVEVVAGVTDGEKALAEVKKNAADILLTDIRMPRMDGLELCAELKKLCPYTTIVIMSAYDDFEYAHKAIRLNVKDYLVKPVDLEQLEELIIKIVKQRDEAKKKTESVASMIEQNKSFMKENVLKRFITGDESYFEEQDWETCFDIEQYNEWTLLEIRLEHTAYEEEIKKKIKALSEEYEWKWVRLDYERNIVCCFEKGKGIQEKLRTFKENCESMIAEYEPDAYVCFFTGTIVNEATSLNISYHCIEALEKYLYVHNEKLDLNETDLESSYGSSHSLNTFVIEYLADMVLSGQDDRIETYVDKLYVNLKGLGGDSKIMFVYAQSLFMIEVQKKVKGYQIDSGIIHQEYDSWYKDIVSTEKLSDGIYYFRQMLLQMSNKISRERNASEVGILKKACMYIDEHFTDSGLRVSEVADCVGVSSNYFSTLFKEQAGISFSEYVMKKRIEEAQKLVCQQRLRSNEVAAKVGFDNPNYFSTAFKKHTGFTVSQFRDRYGGPF